MHRRGIHSIVTHGEAASSNKEAAEKYVGEFRDFVNAGGYLLQQVLNCNKTGLFWEKMPKGIYVDKPMKDRITILACANACGDCKIKPMVNFATQTKTTPIAQVLG